MFCEYPNEEPRSKLETSVLTGIFVGEEIYCTGGVHTPIRKSGYNIFRGDKFSGANSGVWTPPSNQTMNLTKSSIMPGKHCPN
jgi:hypothetical protein